METITKSMPSQIIENPYLEEASSHLEYTPRQLASYVDNEDFFNRIHPVRQPLVEQYAWAIPTQEALEMIARHSPDGVVETGAGNGYWAHLISQVVPIICYDKNPCHHVTSKRKAKQWYDIQVGTANALVQHGDRTLFLCWPPYGTSMAFEALTKYEESGGTKLIYVGEGYGGCTGDCDFHDLLEEKWQLIDGCDIPRWPGLKDWLQVYQKL